MRKMMKIYMRPSVRIVNVNNEGHLMAGSGDPQQSESIDVVVDGFEDEPSYKIPTISSDGSNPFQNNKYLDD